MRSPIILFFYLTFLLAFPGVILLTPQRAPASIYGTSFQDLLKGLNEQEKSLALPALKTLRAYSMLNLIESHIQLENYLYCLNPHKEPRSFLTHPNAENKSPYMFSFELSCEQALNQLYENVYSVSREMRIHMAIAFASIDEGRQNLPHSTRNRQDRFVLNLQPRHIYNELPRLAPLMADEIEDALEIVRKAEGLAIESYRRRTNPTRLNSIQEKSIRRDAQIDQMKNSMEEYKNILEKLPVVGFLANTLSLPPSDLDLSVLRHSFEKLKTLNCSYLGKNYLKPGVKKLVRERRQDLLWVQDFDRQSPMEDQIIEKLCSQNFLNDPLFNSYYKFPELKDFIALTNHAYRHQVFGLESSIFPVPLSYHIDNLPMEELIAETDNFVESLLEISGAKLFSEKIFQPFHSPLDISNEKEFLFLLSQLPVIERLKRIPHWHHQALVLEKMADNASSSELWADVSRALTLVAGGFACHFGLKYTLKKFGGVENYAIRAVNKILTRATSKGEKHFNSEFCHVPAALSGSLLFYNLETRRYNNSFESFFASPLSENIIGNFDDLEGARFAIFLETLFLIYDVYSIKNLVPNPTPLFKKMKNKILNLKRTPSSQMIPRGFYE